MLAADSSSDISVKGLLIIDTSYHIPWSKFQFQPSEPHLPALPKEVLRSFQNCKSLLDTWELPQWDAAAYKGRTVHCTVKNDHLAKNIMSIPAGHVLHKPLQSESRIIAVANVKHDPQEAGSDDDSFNSVSRGGYSLSPVLLLPPSAVLLRCNEYTKSKDPSGPPTRMDCFRTKRLLGWDENYPEFIKAVIDLDAHHYNIFDIDKVGLIRSIVDRMVTTDS